MQRRYKENFAPTPLIDTSRRLLGEIRHALIGIWLTRVTNCAQINVLSPSESVSLDTTTVQRVEMFPTVMSSNVMLGVVLALSMQASSYSGNSLYDELTDV